jgi:phosphate transport system ATP-binding protein
LPPLPVGASPAATPAGAAPKLRVEHLSVQYSDGTESLRGISLDIAAHQITVLFGPAGGGKSTLLRTLNRLNDLVESVRVTGHIYLDGEDILRPGSEWCAAAAVRHCVRLRCRCAFSIRQRDLWLVGGRAPRRCG